MTTRIRTDTVKATVATGLVILLYPCFYLYNVGLVDGWFQQFLGGWFGPVSVIVGLPFAIYLAFDLIRRHGHLMDRFAIFLCVLIAYCAVWATAYVLFESVYGQASAMYYYTLEFLLLWLVTYIAFKHFDYSSTKVLWILVALWLAMFGIAVAGQQHGMYYAASDVNAGESLRIASYQGFARSALITSALIMIRLRGLRLMLFALGSLVLLFLLGARTEFVGIGLIIVLAFVAGRGNWVGKITVSAVAILLVGGLMARFGALVDQSRIANLLHLAHDTSWQNREMMQAYAESTIQSNWVLGAYGSQVQLGSIGTYAHNALSAWVSFGLLGFLLFVGLNLTCFVYMLRVAFKSRFRTAGLVQFALAISAYAVLCMIFAKNVSDPIFSVAWGATAAVAATRRISSARALRGRMTSTGADASGRAVSA